MTSGADTYGRGGSNELVGLAGRALKPISLGVVRQLRQYLPKRMQIIGVGGIHSAQDVQDYLLAGASAVQLASVLQDDGLATFEKILYQDSLCEA